MRILAAIIVSILIGLFVWIATTATWILGTYTLVRSIFYRKHEYTIEVWMAFDKMWNALRGGDHRETISSAIGKSVYYGGTPVFKWRRVDSLIATILDKIDKDHTKNAIDWSVGTFQRNKKEQ